VKGVGEDREVAVGTTYVGGARAVTISIVNSIQFFTLAVSQTRTPSPYKAYYFVLMMYALFVVRLEWIDLRSMQSLSRASMVQIQT
jgi:hypothetical protein